MKKLLKPFLAGALCTLLAIVAIAASIGVNLSVPVTWSVPNGTNTFGLDASAIPTVTLQGTNWTGISTTQTLNTTNVLKFINGVLVKLN